jgi:hypothetical protein
MPEHHTLTIRGRAIGFHIYVTVPDSEAKVRSLERYFTRLPDPHLDIVYPIFVMEHKPGGRDGGGTWRPGEVRSQVMGAAHTRNTLVPDADIETYVTSRGLGMIGISRDRWERPVARIPATVFHEVGHCVDSLGLVPHGAGEADFPGMNTHACGAGSPLVRRAVEAYARTIYNPRHIYHDLPPGAAAATVNAQLLATLRRSPAFRTVPAGWPPP